MKRFALTVLSCLLCLAFSAENAAAEKILKAQSVLGEMQIGSIINKKTLFRILNESGLFKVQPYYVNAFGTPDQTHNLALDGGLQIVEDSSGNLGQLSTTLHLFDLPYLFYDNDEIDYFFGSGKYTDQGPTELWKKLRARFEEEMDCKLLYISNLNFRALLLNKEVRNHDQAKGLKIRTTTSQMHMNAVKALGMNPTPVPASEIFTSLQQGVVDGCDMNYDAWIPQHYTDACKYALRTDHLVAILVGYCPREWWDGLSDEEKAVLEKGCKEWNRVYRDEVEAYTKESLKEAEASGVKIYDVSDEDMKVWRELGLAFWEKTDPELCRQAKEIRALLDARKK